MRGCYHKQRTGDYCALKSYCYSTTQQERTVRQGHPLTLQQPLALTSESEEKKEKEKKRERKKKKKRMKKEPCVDGTGGGSEGERSGKPISRSLCTRQKSKTCAGSKSELVLEGGTKAMRMCICMICMCERDVVGLRAVARTDTQWKGGRWRCYENSS